MMMSQHDIGLVGLAVMGQNLVLNMESRGFSVAVFNRTTAKVDEFTSGPAAGKNITGACGCHRRVCEGRNRGTSIGRGHHGERALQYDHHVPLHRRFCRDYYPFAFDFRDR